MGTRYPAGLVEWVKDNYLLMDTAELAAGCNERFGTNMNLKADTPRTVGHLPWEQDH